LAPDLKSEIFIVELIAQLVTAINEMDHVHRLIDVSWQTKIRQQDLEQRALENERRAIEDARREVDEKKGTAVEKPIPPFRAHRGFFHGCSGRNFV